MLVRAIELLSQCMNPANKFPAVVLPDSVREYVEELVKVAPPAD
jgi:hypothetical protein